MRIRNVSIPQVPLPAGASKWTAKYPNPADFPFNYYNLMTGANAAGAIGKAPSSDFTVAIVGAGVTGMAAARELVRAGYNVTIYEATSRMCGRHYTVAGMGVNTGMELGAMRFPYFGSAPGSQNCLFDYYLTYEAGNSGHVAMTAPFPNPGAAPGATGIYMNHGHGPNDEFTTPTMIQWPVNDTYPNDPYLAAVAKIVDTFIVDVFTKIVGPVYGTAAWPAMWQQIANQYDKMSFSDLVFAAPIQANDYQNDGWLGGFGMTDLQSEIFYTIGSGDGSWGAFYEVGAMWFIRCVMFGFNSDLQAVFGLSNATTVTNYDATFLDSLGQPLAAPQYSGIQSLAEWLFYTPANGLSLSLADLMNDAPPSSPTVQLFTNCSAQTITSSEDNITITDSLGNTRAFEAVIVTAPIWASDMSIDFEGFTAAQLPFLTNIARAEQHIIASTKVFFPLTEAYWNNPNCSIPQILVTDTFVQDAYGIQWGANDAGVLLASYTWEDDAVKLEPYSTNTQDPASPDNAKLAQRVLAELDRITTSTLNEPISQYVNANDAVVWRWAAARGYNGCAKLYRQRNWSQNYALLTYNQNMSASSGLYFAGESYSVEGGWTEPALRLAIDAVIRLMQNSGATFNGDFSPATDYPNFPNWTIDETYPSPAAPVKA